MVERYTLYGGGVTRSLGVEMALVELGLDYELRPVDPLKREHRTDAFLAINPAGYVPALVTPQGEALHENAAIMLWLADHHRASDLAPPLDHPLRGRFLSKLFFQTNDIQTATKRYFYPHRYAPTRDTVAAVQTAARQAVLERWGVLERHLAAGGPYHLSDRFSLLDLHMAMWAAYGLDTPDDVIAAFPAVARCFELVCERPKSGPMVIGLQDQIRRWREQTSKENST
jgi:glutathione S-transferase